ncbi:MAG TPA: response regulator [Azospirillaceae bacterium]|nr:response regulator [Azospirillaceae bacterium]HRQ80964.1 response regulator [Azospirillaceae bacterium]
MLGDVLEIADDMEHQVVVIDDDPTNTSLMAGVISRIKGCAPVCFTRPAQALAWLAREQPDLVLLDQMMPEMDGLEVLRRIRCDERLRDVPVVMITGSCLNETRMAALEHGATDFLNKPLRPAEFRVRVRNILALRKSQRLLSDRAAHLAYEVQTATREIRARELELLMRLCRASEFRDPETGAHLERMARYAQLIAEALGLGQERAEEIFRAAPMHDVGKLGVPDAILLKAGVLGLEEKVVMRQHTLIGYDILKDSASPLIQLGAEIALSHHERWDGEGYPHGLKGEEIPLSGRIVAVADVFDALTSARCYKAPWTLEAARAHLENGKGGHFDPRCVDALFSCWDAVLDVHSVSPDPHPSGLPSFA